MGIGVHLLAGRMERVGEEDAAQGARRLGMRHCARDPSTLSPQHPEQTLDFPTLPGQCPT